MMAAGVMAGGPPAGLGPFGFGEGYGAFGPYWAFRALGTGMNAREQHPMTPRPDVTRSGRTGSPPCSRTSPQIVIPEILTEEYEPRG